MLYFVNSVLFENSNFYIDFILSTDHDDDDYVSQIRYATEYLKYPYSNLTFKDIKQFEQDVNTNKDIFIINMPYECIKQYYNTNKNFKIINFVINPDIDYLQNPYLSDNCDIYDNIVKCMDDDALNKLITSYNYNDFDVKLNYIAFNENEFSICQDYLMNFYNYKFVKMPEFYKLNIEKNDKYINVKGSDCFNLYDFLGYKPLNFDQLREIEGQTFKISELINYNK